MVQKDFTGAIAVSLAMDPAGKTKEFRQCIVDVLVESQLDVLDSPRLPDDHESAIYLWALLQLCLPANESGQRRAELLFSLLSSDVRQPMIQLRVPGGSNNIDVKAWAQSVAKALLPSSVGIQDRHRWCNSLGMHSLMDCLRIYMTCFVERGLGGCVMDRNRRLRYLH